jgi:hypothetical protein
VPPDSVRCTREDQLKLASFGNLGGCSAIIHRTVRCSTELSGVPAEQQLLRANVRLQKTLNALQSAPARKSQSRRQKTHRTVYRTCLVHHWTVRWPHKSELQRSEPNGLVTWLAHRTVSDGAPDCPVRLSTEAIPNGHFGGWGYKYPQPPHIQGIQAFTTSHSIQEQYTTLQDTNQSLRSNQSPQFNSSF